SRQLRLRDLAGLIVIDFIDMEYHRNQSSVERKLKEAMRNDRARIQIGRISPFGLMELSRQRLRPSLTETVTDPCSHCGGTGIRRSTESSALHVLRGIEEEAAKNPGRDMEVNLPGEVALYILNHKRQTLSDIEAKFQLRVVMEEDISLIPPDFKFGRSGGDGGKSEQREAKQPREPREPREQRGHDNDEQSAESNGEDGKRKRRRRPRRKNRGDDAETSTTEETAVQANGAEAATDAQSGDTPADDAVSATSDEDGTEKKPSRRRGRRGGRRRSRKPEDAVAADGNTDDAVGEDSPQASEQPNAGASPEPSADVNTDAEAVADATTPAATEEKPKRPRRRRAPRNGAETSADTVSSGSTEVADVAPANGGTTKEAAPTETAVEGVTVSGTTPPPATEEEAPRRGWWRRSQ
ncbi:MAG: ribonuclease E/G, partial [Proteobacteria bacterium]|nr:ribonuclease E/G [Pseudomonadota bacterium]